MSFLIAYAWVILQPGVPARMHLTLTLTKYAAWVVFGTDYVVRVAVADHRSR